MRLGATALFFLSVAVAIGVVALLPSYILSRGQETKAAEDLALLQKTSHSQDANQAEASIKTTKALITAFEGHQDTVPLSLIIETVVLQRKPGISITSVQVKRSGMTDAALNVAGVATSRDALLTFQKSLAKDPHFSKVDLPISDLAKTKDIRFNITAVAKW
ncbi:MAG: hypothetical protein RIT04_540 [Candidatus Parcubacteria bacterium]